MDEVLLPRERRDAVVFIGVDAADNVEFVKVYAVSEEKAKEALEKFFNARGLFPADYRLVSRGIENVKGKGAITTRTETSLSSALARLGLKLLSNGVLHLEGAETVYQLTLVSEELYSKLMEERAGRAKRRGLAISIAAAFSLGFSVLVVNLRAVNLRPLIPPGAVLLTEPEPDEVLRLMMEGKQVIVETVWPSKYMGLPFGVRVKIPPMSKEEFAEELKRRTGVSVERGLLEDYPEWLFNYRNLEFILQIFEKLVEKGVEKEEALEIAVMVNLGFIPSEFEGLSLKSKR